MQIRIIQVVTDVECGADHEWGMDVSQLRCLPKCRFDKEWFDLGARRQLAPPNTGYRWTDGAGRAVNERACFTPDADAFIKGIIQFIICSLTSDNFSRSSFVYTNILCASQIFLKVIFLQTKQEGTR